MPDRYFLRSGYRSRAAPAYDGDAARGVTWQPDVYELAGNIARSLGSRRIVDIGCGRGAKLVAHHPEFDVIGLDFFSNIAHCRASYPFAAWIEHDLERQIPLPITPSDSEDAVIVCADVVEHLINPEHLLAGLFQKLEFAGAILISTPERELLSGVRSLGPPRNVCHVREWSLREFQALLVANGFVHYSLGLTRSNDRTDDPHTILALVTPNRERLAELTPLLIDFSAASPRHHPARIRLMRSLKTLIRG